MVLDPSPSPLDTSKHSTYTYPTTSASSPPCASMYIHVPHGHIGLLRCRSLSAKEPLIIRLFCGKRPIKMRQHTHLYHLFGSSACMRPRAVAPSYTHTHTYKQTHTHTHAHTRTHRCAQTPYSAVYRLHQLHCM